MTVESDLVHRAAAGKLLQVSGPAATKLSMPSVVRFIGICQWTTNEMLCGMCCIFNHHSNILIVCCM